MTVQANHSVIYYKYLEKQLLLTMKIRKRRKIKGISGIPLYYNNMKLTFKKLRLDENQEYDAVVRNVVVNEEKGKVRVFIEIEGIKEQTFMKSIPLELTEGSMLWNFCNNNELLDRRGNVETDNLIGRDCVVTLSRGNDSNWYVDQLDFYIETEADDDWGYDFDDDEDIDFGD